MIDDCDSEIVIKHGRPRKRYYSERIGPKDTKAMLQAFKDIHAANPCIHKSERVIVANATYKKIIMECLPLNKKGEVEFNSSLIMESPAKYRCVMDRYSIRGMEIAKSPKNFQKVLNQVQVINVRQW